MYVNLIETSQLHHQLIKLSQVKSQLIMRREVNSQNLDKMNQLSLYVDPHIKGSFFHLKRFLLSTLMYEVV